MLSGWWFRGGSLLLFMDGGYSLLLLVVDGGFTINSGSLWLFMIVVHCFMVSFDNNGGFMHGGFMVNCN